jgi:hypothetical protein
MWFFEFLLIVPFIGRVVMSVDVVINNHCDFDVYAWNVVQGEQRTTTDPDWTICSGETHRSLPERPIAGNPSIKLNIDPYLVDPMSESDRIQEQLHLTNLFSHQLAGKFP